MKRSLNVTENKKNKKTKIEPTSFQPIVFAQEKLSNMGSGTTSEDRKAFIREIMQGPISFYAIY